MDVEHPKPKDIPKDRKQRIQLETQPTAHVRRSQSVEIDGEQENIVIDHFLHQGEILCMGVNEDGEILSARSRVPDKGRKTILHEQWNAKIITKNQKKRKTRKEKLIWEPKENGLVWVNATALLDEVRKKLDLWYVETIFVMTKFGLVTIMPLIFSEQTEDDGDVVVEEPEVNIDVAVDQLKIGGDRTRIHTYYNDLDEEQRSVDYMLATAKNHGTVQHKIKRTLYGDDRRN